LTVKDIPCRYDIDEEAFSLFKGYEERKNILLVIKEAMNNIAKYSEASGAHIIFKRQDDKNVFLMIGDNGKGFDTTTAAKGNGLKNMQARVLSMKGNFSLVSNPGKGTRISVLIPIP
jgi:signal transduction histidine kinase